MTSNLQELITLINDSLSGKVGLFNEGAAKYTDQAIREAFFDLLGSDKLDFQNFRKNKYDIYTIMENIITTNLPEAWNASPFYQQFVQVKSALLGDTNEFLVEDNSTIYTSKISGNHWDIERQKIYGRKAFSVSTSWIGARVYNELERFLKGLDSLADMVRKIQRSMQNEIDAMIYAAFSNVGQFLPSKFLVTGTYDKQELSDLIQRVQLASQKNVIIAGTKGALAHIVDNMDGSRMSERQKEELATNGALINYTGLGVVGCEIPNCFIRGTYDFQLDSKTIYVLPDNEQFIKLFYEGETRIRENTDPASNMDMTIDLTYETKLGCATIISNLCGKYVVNG